MPLVAYDSSDDEADDDVKDQDNKDEGKEGVPETAKTEASTKADVAPDGGNSKVVHDLPVTASQVQDISWHLLSKNSTKSQTVKIFAPKIPELDPEDKVKRTLKRSTKGSSLIALLPTPKRETSIMPSQVRNMLKVPQIKKVVAKTPSSSSKLKNKPANKHQGKAARSDSEDEDFGEENTDFLGLSSHKSDKESTRDTPHNAIEEMKLTNETYTLAPAPELPNDLQAYENAEMVGPMNEVVKTKEARPVELNDDALAQLIGSKGKRKRCDANIEIIDVDASALVKDSAGWQTKELTMERKAPSRKRIHNPTTQQRRKHQITYLAFQAKEQELELTNQWANNRMTRKQTQAKYGF